MGVTGTQPLLTVGVPGGPALPTGEADVLGFVDELERRLDSGPSLVLVHDDRPVGSAPGAPAHRLALVHAALARDDVLLRQVTGPVSRTLLVSDLLAEAGAGAARGAAALDTLLGAVRTYALLGSVARLERPAPSVAQHARGLVPGGCFLVDDETVAPVKGRLPRGLGRGAAGVLATGTVDTGDWPDRLWVAVGPPVTPPDPVQVEGRSVWGASRWAEVSVVERATADRVHRLAEAPLDTCSWCGREVLTDNACPFCRAVPRQPDPTATSPEASS